MCRIMKIACCIVMMFISLKTCFISFLRILNFSSIVFINEMCVVALAFVVTKSMGLHSNLYW